MNNLINKKTYLKIIAFSVTSFLLSGCVIPDIRLKQSLEKNAYWSDKNGLIGFMIQGNNKQIGWGSALIGEERVEGGFEFNVSTHALYFRSDNKDGQIFIYEFRFNGYSKNRLIIQAVSDYRYGDYPIFHNPITIEKTKLSESALDARYFFGSDWRNEDDNLRIKYYVGWDYGWRGKGTLCEEKFSFNFLENKHFSISFPDGDTVSGTYMSFKDASMVLNVSEGDRLNEFGSSIKLTCKSGMFL